MFVPGGFTDSRIYLNPEEYGSAIEFILQAVKTPWNGKVSLRFGSPLLSSTFLQIKSLSSIDKLPPTEA